MRVHPLSLIPLPSTIFVVKVLDETGDLSPGEGFPSVALTWPGPYSIGMSSLGYHLVRQRLKQRGCRVERAFCEARPTRSLETDRVVSAFDVLAISIAFELDYPMLLELLDGAGLPLLASQRPVEAPLVVLGGSAITVNRLPIYAFADAFMHGEGEDALDAFAATVQQFPDFRSDLAQRRALYARLSEIPGLEITAGAWRAVGGEAPALQGASWEALENSITAEKTFEGAEDLRLPPVEAARATCLDAAEMVSRIVTENAGLGRRVLVEIARGCLHFCAYCWLGWNCRPFSARPVTELLSMIDDAARQTDCNSVGLVSAAVGAHPEIDVLLEGLFARDTKISFSSIRAEELSPLMVQALIRSGQRGVTLAPESGNVRLRKSLGKSLEDSVFWEAIERAQEAGLADLKLYFMTGLPGETDEDAESIAAFVRQARELLLKAGRPRGRLGTLSVNLGIFVPKPGTPFSKREILPLREVKKRTAKITKQLAAIPNVRVAAPSVPQSQAEDALSNGGLATARLVYQVWKEASSIAQPPSESAWPSAWRTVLRRETKK
jgi:radical SAM superfamily enzyme YgiQ (UPF0313 family)